MTKETLLELLVKYGAEWAVVGLAALVVYGIRRLQALKIGSAQTDAAVDRILEFARVIVADLEATMRPRVALAGRDGKLTAEEAASLRHVALGRLKALIGEQGLAQLAGALGLAAPQLSDQLVGYLERALLELKAVKAVGSSPTPLAITAPVPLPPSPT